MSASTLPKQIHRYRILQELGRGSMGQVYLARDPNIERRIALKVLMPELLRGEGKQEIRQRFLQEAKAAGGLNHQSIVTIYDADTDPETGCPYLAMEWVPGEPLRNLLRGTGRLAAERAVEIATQVARALDYAHRRDIVHRDVKPANLLIMEDDQVKVVDFGIAKLVSKSLTQPGRVLGSPYYMAPEQVRGLAIDGRTDLFSLGAVLYESLTGRPAFGGETVANVTHKILSADPRPVEIYNRDVPASLRAVVRRALAKLPQDRYHSGAEMAAALETVSAELALGSGTGTVVLPREISDTTTAAMQVRPTASMPKLRPSDVDLLPAASPAGAWRWVRAASLSILLLTSGVLVGRSLGPQLSGRAEDLNLEASVAVPEVEESETSDAIQAETLSAAEPSPAPETNPEAAADVDGLAVADRPREARPSGVPESIRAEGDELDELDAETEDPATAPDPVAFPPLAAVATPALESEAETELATTDLEIVFENRIKRANLSVWIDDRRALSASLEAKSPFKRLRRREHRWQIPVPEGERSIEIRVSGLSESFEARQKSWRVFSQDDPQVLIVELRPESLYLDLSWQESP